MTIEQIIEKLEEQYPNDIKTIKSEVHLIEMQARLELIEYIKLLTTEPRGK